MGKLYSLISALLIAVCSPAAFGQTGYEWWLDNDVSSRHSGTFSRDSLELQVDMSGLNEGLHGFNCRISNGDGTWGSIYRKTILIPAVTPVLVDEEFEFWIDDNYADKVTGSPSAGANAYSVDVQGLSEGLHRINYRVRGKYGELGSIYCKYFLIPYTKPTPVGEAFEYWIDDNYADKVTGSPSAGTNAYTVDVNDLQEGLHRLNYRVRDNYGEWGSIYCYYFCNVEKKPDVSEVYYEYWFDKDLSSRKSGPVDNGQMVFSVDLSGLDETKDFHLFNMRIGDNVNGWGSIYQKIIVINDHKDDDKVVGYRHRINGVDLGYVEIEGGLTDSHSFMVDLPEDLGITSSYNGNLIFNDNVISVEGGDTIHYSIQIKSGMGWSAPRTWDFPLSSNFSTTAVEMAVNSSHEFDAPKAGEFAAVKFTSTGSPLYFRSGVPLAFDLYSNGEIVMEFSASKMESLVTAELEAGEYFGILHDVADNTATKFMFHLMDTPNAVPDPVITFENGLVAITCSRSDAKIFYTLDESEPTEESILYEAPFQLNRNAFIKARAFVPGSGIEPSGIAEFVVDIYKTATPTGVFDIESKTMTLSCATQGASISYRIGTSGEWTSYSAPFTIGRNCTVYAKASFEGYNDSDVAEIAVTGFPDSMPMPEISFSNGNVTITCSRDDAEIRYTIDGSAPTTGSTLYTAPFALTHNAVVKAIAYIPGSDIEPSEIAELVVDFYKTATPTGVFDIESKTMTLSCATQGASISYRIGTSGEWTIYTAPFTIGRNCTVYAKAFLEGYNESDVAEIAVTGFPDSMPMPEITFSNGNVTITCSRADAEIRYTIDGSDPTTGSTLYTAPFALTHNAVVKAIAYIPGSDIEPSEIAELVVDFYKTATPTGVFDIESKTMTLSCATQGASISYSIGTSGEWTSYTAPFSIGRNCTVYAKAFLEGYNESDVAEIAVTGFPDSMPMPEITFSNGNVTITCSRDDAEIRYTIDGSAPTTGSTLYTAPFALTHNAVVKAIAYIPGSDIEPSEIAELAVDFYKTATPTGVFDIESKTMTLSCATQGATISYRIGTSGEWISYTAPFTIGRNCTVYAKASFEGYNDSDVAEIAVTGFPDSMPMPEITFSDGMVTITCSRADAEIRYTIDGSAPTTGSTLYTAPFALTHNAVVKAIAYIPGSDIEPSEIAELVVDFYKTATPTGNYDQATGMLTLKCETEGATISYRIGKNGDWIKYENPISIEENCTVYFKAEAEGYNESEIETINISEFTCSPVKISYNGRFATMQTEDPESEIRYSTDGSDPSKGMAYDGQIDVEGLCTVRAIAIRDGYQNSEISDLRIDRYADEYHAETSAGGLLESCFGWCGLELLDNFEDFSVAGTLNDADYSFLKTMKGLRHLDIGKVADARIPDEAFMNAGIVSISMPSVLTEYGDNILSGCNNLCAVIWNSESKDIESRMTRSLANPNVLVYIPSGVKVEESGSLNIIESGRADAIVLHDKYPFIVPVEFDADEISFTRNFDKETQIGVCGGWETLTLPFQPESISHERAGNIVPYAAWNGEMTGEKPFWLYSSESDGWEAADGIKACVPYIISMPNSQEYVDDFNLPGNVTFSAKDVTLNPDSTMPLITPWKNGIEFAGTFMPKEGSDVRALNDDGKDGLMPGSAFVAEETALPFGAYLSGTARKSIPVFGDWSGVEMLNVSDDGLMIETPAPGMLRISSGRKQKVEVVTATGVAIRTFHLKAGETVTIEGLTRDLYIIGHTKVMVK